MDDEHLTHTEAKKRIDKWLPYTEGKTFDAAEACRYCNIDTFEERHNVVQVLSDYKRRGILEGNRGKYRWVNRELESLDWVDADPTNILEIKWPYGWGDGTSFGFNDNLTLYPGSIVVVSGETNLYKTALLLNVLVLNLDEWEERGVRYLTNEMGKEELRDRLDPFEESYELTDAFGEPRFKAATRYDSYEDVVVTGGMNIIDYLDPGEHPFLVGQQIDAILRKLGDGVAFIALQKRRGAEYGAGGQYSEHRARIVLHLNTDPSGREYLLVKKAKKCRKENLNGKKFSFQIKNGSQFYNIRPYEGGE